MQYTQVIITGAALQYSLAMEIKFLFKVTFSQDAIASILPEVNKLENTCFNQDSFTITSLLT